MVPGKQVLQRLPVAAWLLLPGVANAFVGASIKPAQSQRISVRGIRCSQTTQTQRIQISSGVSPLFLSTASTTSSASASASWDEDDTFSDDNSWKNEEEFSTEDPGGLSSSSSIQNDGGPSSNKLIQEHESWSKALKQALEKLGKKHQSLESEFRKAQGIEETVTRAQLLVSNLYLFPRGTKSSLVPDWENGGVEVEVKLNPKYDSASDEADALFAQARKLRRGSQIIETLLKETSTALQTLNDSQVDLESAKLGEEEIDEGRLALVKERLIRSARTTNFQIPDHSTGGDNEEGNKPKSRRNNNSKPEMGTPASNVRKLISPGGCTVLVGRNRRGNEYLSLTVARQDDVWMHSRGCPGAHVVVQNRRGGPTPTDDCLQFAADLAIFYSDLRTEAKAEVSAAEPKHLLKPRGAPLGAIKVREEWKTFVGRPDRVPEELKLARDKSGQSDEYRQEDKAKHRRRTKQAAEEDKARRRKNNKN
jgi:predicted ribosome quality control (RQC) complex YloA/Tae2 family protein